MTTTDDRREYEQTLVDAAFGPLTYPLPPVTVLLDYVAPHIIKARDTGEGQLEQLPEIGTEEWHRAGDGTKWATVALAALQGLWAAERGPDERVAYSEGLDRVEIAMDWATYSYDQGYEKGRRDQAATDRRIRSGAQRREQKAA